MSIPATIKYFTLAITMASLQILSGCGGGGGGGGIVPATFVSGTASKGIIFPGTVNLFGVDAGGVKSTTPLATTTTNADGRYMAFLGNYSGPLVVEVSGTYTDEATGAPVTIAPSAPLHALIDQVDPVANNYRVISVTPLTELAYTITGTTLERSAIAAANERVAQVFKIDDILAVEPVRPEPGAMGGAGVSTAQQAYTLALATLSRMARDAGGGAPSSMTQIRTMLDSFRSDLATSATSGLSAANSAAFAAALNGVISAPDMSAFGNATDTLASVGTTTFRLTLTAAGVPAGVKLGALKATLTLPAGVTLRADSTGRVLDGLIVPVGSAASGAVQTIGRYEATAHSLVLGLITSTGFGVGDCAAVIFDIANSATVTPADFQVVVNETKDTGPTYGPVAGVTLTLK